MRFNMWLIRFIEYRLDKYWNLVYDKDTSHHRILSAMDGVAKARMYIELIVGKEAG